MYLAIRRPASKGLLFDVPHKPEPMTVKEIMKELPKFAAMMDGTCEENTLLFYYKKNKETQHYVFQDTDAEQDIADLMGVEVGVFSDKQEPLALKPLTEEELQKHKENLEMIREGLKTFESREKN